MTMPLPDWATQSTPVTPSTSALVTHASGPGQGMPLVAGHCPACRGSGLFLAVDGHVTCARPDCPDPAAADGLLHGGPPDLMVVLEDAFCRRVWAGSLRWEANQLREAAPRWEAVKNTKTAEVSRYFADVLEIDAHRIETGKITPWARPTSVMTLLALVGPASLPLCRGCDNRSSQVDAAGLCAGCGPEPDSEPRHFDDGDPAPADAFLADPPERQLAEWERELAVSQSVPAGDATAAPGPTGPRWTPTDRDLAAAAIRHAQEQNHGCHRTATAVLDALTAAGWLAPDQRGTREEADRLIAVIRAQERAKAGEDAARALLGESDTPMGMISVREATEIVREVTRATGEEVKSR